MSRTLQGSVFLDRTLLALFHRTENPIGFRNQQAEPCKVRNHPTKPFWFCISDRYPVMVQNLISRTIEGSVFLDRTFSI